MPSPPSSSSSSELRRVLADRPERVAVVLLGWVLETRIDDEVTTLRIAEVEAYGGADDPASHAHRGRTGRNGSMFGPPGTLYTYRSYGIHTCANVVAGPEGVAGAVLIRAGVPLEGRDVMVRRRGRAVSVADGPGKLCQALGIALGHDGIDVLDPGSDVRLLPGSHQAEVRAGPRIGITRGVDLPWRFVATAGVRD